MFKALLLHRDDDRNVTHEVTEVDDDALPDGDVTVDVEYTTINYKDGLAITNSSPIVRQWPMVPGIDLAGIVTSSDHAEYAAGDRVVLNGWGVGESHWGGLAGKARVDGDWLVHLPSELTTRQAMTIGTAGYTSMLCVLALERHGVTPDGGPVVVTGAAGGVGSVAIAILAKLGYSVIASSRRVDSEADYLTRLGADEIIDAAELSEAGKPLSSIRWAGAIDAVGSHTLANVLAATEPRGCVAACGLAQGPDLPTTVMPFIIRGVTLAGIDSVMAPRELRVEAWGRLAADLDSGSLDAMASEVGLGDVPGVASDIVAGRTRGRVIVSLER